MGMPRPSRFVPGRYLRGTARTRPGLELGLALELGLV